MNEIKPIETVYNGYRFRSRLEARWAVFFDALDIEYEYEPEGFERNGIRYLPDFYFPKTGLYGEVKGARCLGEISKQDMEKMSWMIDFDGPCSNGIVLLGNIPYERGANVLWLAILSWRTNGKGVDFFYAPLDTELENLSFYSDDFTMYRGMSAPFSFDKTNDLVLTHVDVFVNPETGLPESPPSNLELALLKARQTRFEFGENPTIMR